MSSGRFSQQVYVTDGGLVTTVRVQPETVTAWNPNGAGTIGVGLPSASVSGGLNKIGINARRARFEWTGSPPVAPAGYDPNGIIALPILTLAAHTALVKATAYPYLGATLNLVGKTGERIR